MTHKGAFTLIELLIYVSLLVGLSFLTLTFASRTYRFMVEQSRSSSFFMRSIIACDLVRRDLQVASPWPSDWDVGHTCCKQLTMDKESNLVERWVGYEVKKGGLYRREGRYLNGHWGESSLAILDPHVTRLEFKPIRIERPEPTIKAVMITITYEQGRVYTMPVALRNRVLS